MPDVSLELRDLEQLLGDTRARFHRRETPVASSDGLIAIDREIRDLGARPPTVERAAEIRALAARLRALDPR